MVIRVDVKHGPILDAGYTHRRTDNRYEFWDSGEYLAWLRANSGRLRQVQNGDRVDLYDRQEKRPVFPDAVVSVPHGEMIVIDPL
jgi:hypothetical protein